MSRATGRREWWPNSKELGARFLATHGGFADYVLVAEGTGFGIVWIEAGKFWFKVTLRSQQPAFYTPYMPERTLPAKSPNMIVAATVAIEAIERWAADYEQRSVLRAPSGEVRPKVLIGAIRSGEPTRPFLSPQLCNLYLDVRAVPGKNPLDLRDEIRTALAATGIEHDIELYLSRPGYEAKGVEPLVAAVTEAHRAVIGGDPPAVVRSDGQHVARQQCLCGIGNAGGQLWPAFGGTCVQTRADRRKPVPGGLRLCAYRVDDLPLSRTGASSFAHLQVAPMGESPLDDAQAPIGHQRAGQRKQDSEIDMTGGIDRPVIGNQKTNAAQ